MVRATTNEHSHNNTMADDDTMADINMATRAPESDAQEKPAEQAGQSIFPGDTPAQTGPTMGVGCTFLLARSGR